MHVPQRPKACTLHFAGIVFQKLQVNNDRRNENLVLSRRRLLHPCHLMAFLQDAHTLHSFPSYTLQPAAVGRYDLDAFLHIPNPFHHPLLPAPTLAHLGVACNLAVKYLQYSTYLRWLIDSLSLLPPVRSRRIPDQKRAHTNSCPSSTCRYEHPAVLPDASNVGKLHVCTVRSNSSSPFVRTRVDDFSASCLFNTDEVSAILLRIDYLI